MMNNRLLFILVFMLLNAGNCLAQQSPEKTNVMLSGHLMMSEALIGSVTNIVIASFSSIGVEGGDAAGEEYYEHATIHIRNNLLGFLSGAVNISYAVLSMHGADREAPPVVGVSYIMFITSSGNEQFFASKILDASPENISNIQKLISTKATK